MIRVVLLLALACCCVNSQAQNTSQLDTVGNTTKSENLYVKFLHGDSLVSSFCIVIKKEVKAHLHQFHSEHVTILEGEGTMKLGGSMFKVKKGDLVFIPRNTVHSVISTGKTPLKVLSIQAPQFNGSDRVFVEEK